MTPRAQGWLFAVGFSIAVWAALALAVAPAFAQQSQVQTQPLPRATTDASSTVAITNTFQQVWAAQGAPQGPVRSACSIQNNGTHTMWVFAGAPASAAKTSSMVLPPGAIYHCGHNEVVGTSAISITGTATDAFTASLEGAPTVVPASPAEGGSGTPTDVNVAQWGGAATTLGQKAMTASVPVVIASDQSNLPANITQVGSAAVTAINTNSNNYLPVAEPDELAIPSTSVTSATTIFTQDMIGYQSISVQVTSAGSASTITYETSDDNTNWVGAVGISSATSTGALAGTSTAVVMNLFRKAGRYFRARVSTYGSGTVTVVGNLHKNPLPLTNRITVDGNLSQGTALSSTTNFGISVAGQSANPTAVTNFQAAKWIGTLLGVGIVKPFSIPELDWQQPGLTLTASNQAMVAAGGAGVKNYMTGFQVSCNSAWLANTIEFEQGTTAIWDLQVPSGAGVYNSPPSMTPLQSAAAAAINVKATGAVTGTCLVAGTGYAAAD